MFTLDTTQQVLAEFKTSAQGLTMKDIEARRADYGFNDIPEQPRSLFMLFVRQFHDVLIYILLGALVLSAIEPFFSSEPITAESFLDAGVILAILLLNSLLGFVQEYKAEEAIAMLKKLSSPQVRVRRNGDEQLIPSRELIPGDIVILEAGDRVSADGRLILESHLEMNESSLTGESLPVDKMTDPLAEESSLPEQRNMVFHGTTVTRGSGEYVVTAIGLETELGRIAAMVEKTTLPETPLQRRLRALATQLGALVLGLAVIVVLLQLFRHAPITASIVLGISLAVSAVPEGLPAVVTACLAIGVRKMVSKNVLVRRLESLETLGSVTVICTDKTGTITENRMEVVEAWTVPGLPRAGEGSAVGLLAQIGASCNRARLPDLGDPTELGLLQYAKKEGVERLPIDDEEVPFTSEEKYMQTRHGERVFLKGATEKIIQLSHDEDVLKEEILRQSDAMASKGLRVLACAMKTGKHTTCIGLLAMEDPPRRGVKAAIAEAKRAGIRTIMITGDSLRTAQAIAEDVGIHGETLEGKDLVHMSPEELSWRVRDVSVFARVSPEHKVAILEALQRNGEIVAMSGDGVNDAPALKGAHVGVAMGQKGTDVAREAASIVLTDDHYATIVSAIRQGRHIYANIRKFILYLLHANFYELMLFLFTLLAGLPIPYLPLHILWINLMTDGLPALSLGMEPEEEDIMNRPPRSPTESLFHHQWWRLMLASFIAFTLAAGVFLWYLLRGYPLEHTRTAVFTFAILFEVLLVFTMRSAKPLWKIGITSNPWLLGAVSVPLILQLLILYTPLHTVFHLTPLGLHEWLALTALGSLGFVCFEAIKVMRGAWGKARG